MPILGLAATLSGKDLPKFPGQEHLWTTRDMLNGASLAFEGLGSGTRKTLRFLGAKPETAQDTTDALGTAVGLAPTTKLAAIPKAIKGLTKAVTPAKAVPKLDLSKMAPVPVKKVDAKKVVTQNNLPKAKAQISLSSPNVKVTGPSQTANQLYNASNPNAKTAINKKLSALEKAQKLAVKIETIPDGRVRYYAKERFATKPGPTRGSSYVTEHNPTTGQIRSWIENYKHDGSVNRVHPKMLDGQDLISQHYPPTQIEINSYIKKPGGKK